MSTFFLWKEEFVVFGSPKRRGTRIGTGEEGVGDPRAEIRIKPEKEMIEGKKNQERWYVLSYFATCSLTDLLKYLCKSRKHNSKYDVLGCFAVCLSQASFSNSGRIKIDLKNGLDKERKRREKQSKKESRGAGEGQGRGQPDELEEGRHEEFKHRDNQINTIVTAAHWDCLFFFHELQKWIACQRSPQEFCACQLKYVWCLSATSR